MLCCVMLPFLRRMFLFLLVKFLINIFMFNMYADSERHDSPNSSLYTGKRRRSLPKVSDGIASIMETNREKTIAAMIEGEDRADTRHKQLLDLELKKHNDNMALQKASLEAQTSA